MAEADPLRLRILKALTNALLEITPANGYRFDLGPDAKWKRGKVFRGRLSFGEKDPLPMVSILEVPIPLEQIPEAPDNPARKGPWELIVQGFVQDDPENPTDPAQHLMAAVVKRLAIEKKRNRDFDILGMGDDVINLTLGVGVTRPPDDISSKAYFWLPIRLTVAEDLDNPYAE
jgi:hypothetical protein